MASSPLQTARAACDVFRRWKRNDPDRIDTVNRKSLFWKVHTAFIVRDVVRRFAAENNFSGVERKKLSDILDKGVCEVVYVTNERSIVDKPIRARALFLVAAIDVNNVHGYPVRAEHNPQFPCRVDSLYSLSYNLKLSSDIKKRILYVRAIMSGVANQYIRADLSLAGSFASFFNQPCFGSAAQTKKSTMEVTASDVSVQHQ